MEAPAPDHPSAGHLRASDAERDRALSELSAAFQTGRITAEEFDQRSTLALSARTGNELSALFGDLRARRAPATVAGSPARARAVLTRTAMGAAAAAAISLAAVALSNALSAAPALTLAQREFRRQVAQQVLARQGITAPVPLPPAGGGFDWAGTITPAAIAAMLIVVIVILSTRLRRAERSRLQSAASIASGAAEGDRG